MFSIFETLTRRFKLFLKEKTLFGRVAELEKRVAALEKQNKKLKKNSTKTAAKKDAKEKAAKAPKKDKKGHSQGYYKKVEDMIAKVSAKMGWDHDTVAAKFEDATKRTGCTPKEYYLYKMYDMTDAEQETVLVASIQKLLQKKYGVNKDFVDMLYDKERTNKYFAEYIRRPWCVNTKVSFEEFSDIFKNTSRVIYKPLDGNRGKGVEAFNLDPENIREVYEVLASYVDGVVEEYVVQHPDMLKLCPSSVNTIRVVTFSSNSHPVTKDGKYMDIAYTSLRIGGGGAIVDNFHSGGMVSHIDMETGKLITDAADMDCNVFVQHPVTGVTFKDFQIPYYKQVLEMVTEAITKNKIEGYLGWDVAIAEDGPILIEVNDRPGVVLLSTPYAAQKKGMRHVMAKYL